MKEIKALDAHSSRVQARKINKICLTHFRKAAK